MAAVDVDMLSLVRAAREAAEEANEKFSRRDYALRRTEALIQQAPQPVNMGTWHPFGEEEDEEPEEEEDEEALAPSAFKLFDRSTTFDAPDWNDPVLSEGFDGEERDRENYVGHQLIRRWKRDKDPKDLERLFGHYDQAIGSTIRMYARRPLPEPAIVGRVYNAFSDALDAYDFREGSGGKAQQFHNFFTGWYAHRGAVKHWADTHSGFTRAPFERARKQDIVRNIVEEFHLSHDREPTAQEIHLSSKNQVTVPEIRKILKELESVGVGSKHLRSDFVVADDRIGVHAVRRVRDRLQTKDKAAFEAWFAEMLGKPDPLKGLKKTEVAAKLGITPQKLSKRFSKFQSLIQAELDLIQADL